MSWLPPSLFYIIGLILFFFPNFFIKLVEPAWITRTEGRRKFAWYYIIFFGGLVSNTVGISITGSYAMELLNLEDIKYTPMSIKMFSMPFTAILIISGMIGYYTSYNAMYIIRNLVKIITKNEEMASIAHKKANKIFQIYCVILILAAPILGIWSVNHVLGM